MIIVHDYFLVFTCCENKPKLHTARSLFKTNFVGRTKVQLTKRMKNEGSIIVSNASFFVA